MTTKVLLATSIGPGKEYVLPFMQGGFRAIEGYDDALVTFDRITVPEILSQSVRDNETYEYLPDITPPYPSTNARVPYLARMRQAQIDHFLMGDWTHLYWHDSDTISPPEILSELLKINAPVSSGVYLLRGVDNVRMPFFPVLESEPIYTADAFRMTWDENLQSEAALAGFGCMLIERSILEKTQMRDPMAYATQGVGDDYLWCADANRNSGVSVHLDGHLSCWHLSETGTGNYCNLGGHTTYAIWIGSGTVSNEFGLWYPHTPRYGFPQGSINMLGPEFVTGVAPYMECITKPTNQILTENSISIVKV